MKKRNGFQLVKQQQQPARGGVRLDQAQPLVDPARFHPMGQFLLVELKLEKMTRGGIILPDSSTPNLPRALVLEAGPDCKVLKKGDGVLLFMSSAIALDGYFYLVKEESIAAKLDEQPLVTTQLDA